MPLNSPSPHPTTYKPIHHKQQNYLICIPNNLSYLCTLKKYIFVKYKTVYRKLRSDEELC